MVLYTVSKYVTHWMGPRLLRFGIAVRNQLPNKATATSTSTTSTSSSYYYDLLCGIPMAQRLLSLSIYEECAQRTSTTSSTTGRSKQDDDDDYDYDHPNRKRKNDHSSITTIASMAKLRIQVLDEQLLPALVPSITTSTTSANTNNNSNNKNNNRCIHTVQQDIAKWNWNVRILKWVRQEVLIAQYGPFVKEALDAYPQLRMSPQLTRHPTQRMLLNLARGRLEWDNHTHNTGNTSSDTTTSSRGQEEGKEESSLSSSQNKKKQKMMTTPLLSSSSTRPKHPHSSQLLLPSSETITKAFSMRDWATTKQSIHITDTENFIRQQEHDDHTTTTTTTAGTFSKNNNNSSSSSSSKKNNTKASSTTTTWSMPEILDLATGGSGGPIQECGPFNTVCEEANIYQLWTKEYVQHLGDYLIQRASASAAAAASSSAASASDSTGSIENTTTRTTLILDIGAGDGLLLHYLQEYYHQQERKRGAIGVPRMEWIATDDKSWRIFAKAPVETLNAQQALQKYAQNDGSGDGNGSTTTLTSTSSSVIVICSWMPMGQDWTQLFRDSHKVDEYILIGEADDGSCGDNWNTWGNLDFWIDQDDATSTATATATAATAATATATATTTIRHRNHNHSNNKMPPYQRDGFHRWDMDAILAPFQFSRFDCAVSKSGKTVSFRRRR